MARLPSCASHELDGYDSYDEYESTTSASVHRAPPPASQSSRSGMPPPGISTYAPGTQWQGRSVQRAAASKPWPQGDSQGYSVAAPPGITVNHQYPARQGSASGPRSYNAVPPPASYASSDSSRDVDEQSRPSSGSRQQLAPPAAGLNGAGRARNGQQQGTNRPGSGSSRAGGRPGTGTTDASRDDSWRDGGTASIAAVSAPPSDPWLNMAASLDPAPLLAASSGGPTVPAPPKTASKPPPSMLIGPDGVPKSRMKNKTSKGKSTTAKTKFTEYWSMEELKEAFVYGQIFRAKFRVNAHDPKEAYITLPGLPHDVLLKGPAAQNRGIEGDVVAVELSPPCDWRVVNKPQEKVAELLHEAAASKLVPDSTVPISGEDSLSSSPHKGPAFDHAGFQSMLDALSDKFQEQPQAPYQTFAPGEVPWEESPGPEETIEVIRDILRHRPDLRVTGKVVAILEDSPRRNNLIGVCLGGLSGVMFFQPLDSRLPRCMIRAAQQSSMPFAVKHEAQQQTIEQRTLVGARITEWGYEFQYPCVEIHSSIGKAGEIEAETTAILEMQDIRTMDFAQEVLDCLPGKDWSIREQDLAERQDFRQLRICSIDPPTARDLDDALSIQPLPNGNWRVGVHIADVSHFVAAGSTLDREAMQRCTSVYLVDRVIPMLPRKLCEELCSLNPGVDRLAFSITWELTPEGDIVDQWAGRSVICSCAKLAYSHAQAMIEGRFKPEGCTAKLHNGASWDEIQGDVLALHAIAAHLRRKRFDAGALRLDNTKLTFSMDQDGNPVSCSPYLQQEANQLVEEFMLLANMSVAGIIAEIVPQHAILRCHPAPNQRKLDELQALSQELDFGLDTSSAGALQRSLAETRARLMASDPDTAAVITLLATKPMQLALYFSTGMVTDTHLWRHYALAVDQYTHFTSPIRRYADVLVHRALAAALAVREGMQWQEVAARHGLYDAETIRAIADHANERKLAARNVQDASVRLFLCVMLRSYPVISSAMTLVLGGDKFLNVYLPEFGCECRLYIDQMGIPLKATWNQDTKELTVDRKTPEEVAREEFEKKHRPPEKKNEMNQAVWERSMSKLRNPKKLSPMPLPLRISSFTAVPVVVGALVSQDSGHPSDLMARLYLQDALLEGPPPPAPVVTQRCCIDWGESNLD